MVTSISRLAQRLRLYDDDDDDTIPIESVKKNAQFLAYAGPMIEALQRDADQWERRDESVKDWLDLAADAEDALKGVKDHIEQEIKELAAAAAAATSSNKIKSIEEKDKHLNELLEVIRMTREKIDEINTQTRLKLMDDCENCWLLDLRYLVVNAKDAFEEYERHLVQEKEKIDKHVTFEDYFFQENAESESLEDFYCMEDYNYPEKVKKLNKFLEKIQMIQKRFDDNIKTMPKLKNDIVECWLLCLNELTIDAEKTLEDNKNHLKLEKEKEAPTTSTICSHDKMESIDEKDKHLIYLNELSERVQMIRERFDEINKTRLKLKGEFVNCWLLDLGYLIANVEYAFKEYEDHLVQEKEKATATMTSIICRHDKMEGTDGKNKRMTYVKEFLEKIPTIRESFGDINKKRPKLSDNIMKCWFDDLDNFTIDAKEILEDKKGYLKQKKEIEKNTIVIMRKEHLRSERESVFGINEHLIYLYKLSEKIQTIRKRFNEINKMRLKLKGKFVNYKFFDLRFHIAKVEDAFKKYENYLMQEKEKATSTMTSTTRRHDTMEEIDRKDKRMIDIKEFSEKIRRIRGRFDENNKMRPILRDIIVKRWFNDLDNFTIAAKKNLEDDRYHLKREKEKELICCLDKVHIPNLITTSRTRSF